GPQAGVAARRPNDEDRAGEPGDDGEPLEAGHALAEGRSGQRRDDERSREGDRRGVGERDLADGGDEHAGRRELDHRAADLSERTLRGEETPASVLGREDAEHEDELAGAAGPDHLHRVQVGAEPLHARVHGGEEERGRHDVDDSPDEMLLTAQDGGTQWRGPALFPLGTIYYRGRNDVKLGIDFGTTRIVTAAVDRGNYPLLTFDAREGNADWFPS